MINSLAPNNQSYRNNDLSFKAKLKFVNFKTYICNSIDSINVQSSDVFMPNIGKAAEIKSDGIGPCIAISINGKDSKMIHLRPTEINEKVGEQISGIIESMGGHEVVKNCLIVGGEQDTTHKVYKEIINIAANKFENLKNKITVLCGHNNLGYCTNVNYNSATDTYLLNASSMKEFNMTNNLIKSNKDLEEFYSLKHIAPCDEVHFENKS